MIDIPSALPTQELAEFLAVVSSQRDPDTAMLVAVQQVALALEAEVAAIVVDGDVACSIGFPVGQEPRDELVRISSGHGETLDVPGVGVCAALTSSFGATTLCRLVLARSYEGFTVEEVQLVRAMARVLDLTLESMRTLAREQMLRERSERQAQENARLLESLLERQRLLIYLSEIQQAISGRMPLQLILDNVCGGARSLLASDVTLLLLRDPDDHDFVQLGASDGLKEEVAPAGTRLPLRSSGIAGRSMRTNELIVERYDGDGPDEGLVRPLRAAMAAPVHESGILVGSLIVGTRDATAEYSDGDREVLGAFADHVTLALTDAKTLEAMYEAFHDSLTGLASRALFLDRLQHGLTSAARTGTTIGLLFIDLDRFKMVNDTLGHAAGDLLLVEVAERVRSCLRASDTAARFGGDEFAVLMQGTTEAGAYVVADRIIEAVRAPYSIGGREVFINSSIGIALSDASLMDAHELLRAADVAMYQAKRHGKGRHQRFEPSMHAELMDRLEMEADLRRAIDGNEFVLHYQPIVRLDTGRVTAVEALVRWNHARRGLVPPLDFIPIAEETGLIVQLGQWVLETACAQAAQWQATREFATPLTVTVNLSARQLEQPDIGARVARALELSGLDAGCLVLELTESLLLHDAKATIAKLHELKGLGVRLAIDDFGTGYSSLSYLRQFPVDILKIDKSFIDGISDGVEESAFARAIVRLGKTLHLEMIAEGIEEQAQLAELQRARCQLGQGYYFARPQSVEQMSLLLAGTASDRDDGALPALPAVVPAHALATGS